MSSSQETVNETTVKDIPFATQTQAAEEETDTQEVTQGSTQTESPIYLGGKRFSNVDELARYTSQLEQERTQVAYQAPQTQAAPEKKVSELLFEDPDKALQIHEERIIAKFRAQEEAKRQEDQLWQDFYFKNKDLDSERDVVQFALTKHWNELKGLHPDQATEKLAEITRNTLTRFKKTSGTKQELPSGKAKVGPSGTSTAPRIAEKQSGPVDFVSQLKKIQNKRK